MHRYLSIRRFSPDSLPPSHSLQYNLQPNAATTGSAYNTYVQAQRRRRSAGDAGAEVEMAWRCGKSRLEVLHKGSRGKMVSQEAWITY